MLQNLHFKMIKMMHSLYKFNDSSLYKTQACIVYKSVGIKTQFILVWNDVRNSSPTWNKKESLSFTRTLNII